VNDMTQQKYRKRIEAALKKFEENVKTKGKRKRKKEKGKSEKVNDIDEMGRGLVAFGRSWPLTGCLTSSIRNQVFALKK